MTPAEIRRRLSSLGRRRKERDKQGEALSEEIREAVAEARVMGGITMEEVADRLGLNRTTLYQVYIPDDDGSADTERSPAPARG